MTDIVSQSVRSRMMSRIRGHSTSPEMRVRRYLHAAGLRFRVNDRRLPGRPDLVFPSARVAVFVHGCFWHRHPGCRFSTTPATRPDFWTAKFASNVERDVRTQAKLREAGWTVLTIWECETDSLSAIDLLYWRIRANQSGSGDAIVRKSRTKLQETPCL